MSGIEAQMGVEDGSIFGHGEDSIRCLTNFSLYREYARQNDFESALPYWRAVYKECPLRSKNVYIDGIKMFRVLIENEKENVKALLYVDTLMMIYDQRIKYYPGDKGDQLERKAIDLLKYRRDELEYVEKAYGYLTEAIKLEKSKFGDAGMATFLTASISLYQNKIIDADAILDNYLNINEICIAKLNKSPNDNDLITLMQTLNDNFASLGLSCDVLLPKLTTLFDKDKYNIKNLKIITSILKNSGCVKSDLFYKAAINYHDSLPSAESAANIAAIAFEKGDYKLSVDYFRQATQFETNNQINATYHYGLANALFKYNRLSEAREIARKALTLRDNWGDPYILIGQIYAESKGECSGITLPNAVYWLAIDQFVKAKSVDPTLEETANRLIITYSKYFPSKEDAFFLNIFEGDTYPVGCWINESTRVRF